MSSAADDILYLQELGYKVRVRHYRCGQVPGEKDPNKILTLPISHPAIRAQGYVPGPVGGETVAILYDEHENAIATGRARCRVPSTWNAKRKRKPGDVFNKEIGRQIAIGRMLCTRNDHNPHLKLYPDIMRMLGEEVTHGS